MKKIFILVFLFISVAAYSQLNNNWIDYSKTYYKFKITKSGLYRISQSAVASMNLSGVPAEYFQLWQNGKEVRLFTSVSSGVLGANDYIEFFGRSNDGAADKQLYRKPEYQLCDSISLFTDTAAYFLTVNPSIPNLRYQPSANDVSGTILFPDAYFMRKVDVPFRSQINRGYAEVVGEYVYSSSYDKGEGWTSPDIYPTDDFIHQLTDLNVYTAGPANSVTVDLAAFGNASNSRSIKVRIFDSTVIDESMDSFRPLKKQVIGLPLAVFQNPSTATVYFRDSSYVLVGGNRVKNINDRMVVSDFAITYPATFNFNNQTSFYFELSASSSGNYLEIENFNHGGVAPILYDLTEGKRYVGDIATAGKIKFVLPASAIAARRFELFSQSSGSLMSVNNFATKNFLDFSNSSNQGTYLIITNPSLFNNGSGINYVDQYSQYRSSAAGGAYNTKIISIDELTDQFAFGIKNHPASVRDFIRYAVQQFTIKPQYVFLIGRGTTYNEIRMNESSPYINRLSLVPTFGWPASDVLLACEPGKNVPLVPIGRLSVVDGNEINEYLEKIRQYENVQSTTSPLISEKKWMKNFMHVTGGKSEDEDNLFAMYMERYRAVAIDTFMGATVETFRKISTDAVEQANSDRIKDLINEGIGLIDYFGHSSANVLAFNLSNPEEYNNQGKYPFFNVSGCSAGNFFTYDPLRLDGNKTLSEKYVLAHQRGSIAFLASTHLGIPPYLDSYNLQFYAAICKTLYGNTVGNQLKQVVQNLAGNLGENDFYVRMHVEEITLHGDPALRLNYSALPDYVIEEPLVKVNPANISVADNNFSVSIKMMNIGKSVSDSIRVIVSRKVPDGTVQILYNEKRPGIRNIDSLNLVVPINSIIDKGLNQLTVLLDADNSVAETYENNNSVTKDFYIFEDELRPVYPYNYSIVNQQNITFSASTANPLASQRQFVMELDTTELFNSSFKKQYSVNSTGGVIQFTPSGLTFTDNTVYYWRTSITPLNTTAPIWNNSSFVYLAGSTNGFNQSHYYQHLKSTFDDITLDSDRKFRFKQAVKNLQIRTGLYPYFDYDAINVNLDFNVLEEYGCHYNSLQIIVYDTTTLQPWKNYPVTVGTATEGRFGSLVPCDMGTKGYRNFFEFPYDDPVYRKRAMDFLDNIPDGLFVSITNLGTDQDIQFTPIVKNNSFISDWQLDQGTLGSGNSLYHKLRSIGFTKIDSFYRNIPFVYLFRKNSSSFTSEQFVGTLASDHIEETFALLSSKSSGTIESPLYGPAKNWNSLHWRGNSIEAPSTDVVKIEVYGIKTDGVSELLATVAPTTDTSLSFIDAAVYPYLRLKMYNTDTIFVSPYQLNYWRINGDYVPEGAIAPNILYTMKDTVEQGEKINFSIAFKNISQTAFDSLKIKFVITDRNNVPNIISIPKTKSLVSGDTTKVSYTIDTKDLAGDNTLYVMFNSDNDQREQFYFNNFIYKDFYVKEDDYNPLLDVTFDGVHILNKDIVSASPHILIKLKDESKFLALGDTSLTKVQVLFPDGTLKTYSYKDLLNFTPADLSGGQNTATIDFTPAFTEDGEYQLIVSGKDVNGNKAGYIEYRVLFNVINKAMISNLLNYPNPFTSSTAFVFTVTGSEVPQNIRIQIMTITGKIVKEITMDELGPIHIGRNITDYKWDGTDMYGQKLGNGVYLYRVLTNLNGKSLSKYKAEGDKTDKYFTKGYGKMYLMR